MFTDFVELISYTHDGNFVQWWERYHLYVTAIYYPNRYTSGGINIDTHLRRILFSPC